MGGRSVHTLLLPMSTHMESAAEVATPPQETVDLETSVDCSHHHQDKDYDLQDHRQE